tara:strand:- start:118 stop:669 length:552 start_codon:yes stop_codon:yes gene_type:complete
MKKLTKFECGQTHTKQHAFNDVAVVAQQTSRGSRCVAMVALDIVSRNWGFANGAFMFLNREKRTNGFVIKPGSSPSLTCVNFCSPSRVFCFSCIKFSMLLLDGFLSVVSLLLGFCFRRIVSSQTLCSYFRAHFISPVSGTPSIKVIKPPLSDFLKMSSPFLRSVIGLSFGRHKTSYRLRMNAI